MKYQYDRLLAAVLSLCLLAGLLAPAVRAEETAPETIQIATAEQLEALARDCRLDSWSVGRTVVVTEDIDLTGSDFAGIPTFGGALEGQGHTIRGLNLTEEGSVQGLFRYLQQDARVQDLHVEGSVQPGGSRAVVGGLAGENAGTVSNCTFSGTVSGTRQIGGIAGTNTVTGIITGCTVNGSVYGDHFVGGMAGQNDGVISQCTNQAAINTTVNENEVNLKDLTVEDLLTTERASDITDIGGIAGGSAGVVRACINRGAVGYDHIGYNVGGIAGSQTGYIEGCVNYGTVHARKEGGGIVGQMEPSNVLQYSQDTLQQLQGELNTLQGLMNQATQDAAASSSEVTAQINEKPGGRCPQCGGYPAAESGGRHRHRHPKPDADHPGRPDRTGKCRCGGGCKRRRTGQCFYRYRDRTFRHPGTHRDPGGKPGSGIHADSNTFRYAGTGCDAHPGAQ